MNAGLPCFASLFLVAFLAGGVDVERDRSAPKGGWNCDQMARFVKLVSGSQTCRTRADNGHSLTRAFGGRTRFYPPLLKALVNDCALDALYGNRGLNYAQYARTFAWRWADPTSKLRKVIGLMAVSYTHLTLPTICSV